MPSALLDLGKIAEYIANDSQNYSIAVTRHIWDSAKSLGSNPEAGAIVPEYDTASIREIFVKRYRLIYEVTRDTVDILGVIHGARNLNDLWIFGGEDSENSLDQ